MISLVRNIPLSAQITWWEELNRGELIGRKPGLVNRTIYLLALGNEFFYLSASGSDSQQFLLGKLGKYFLGWVEIGEYVLIGFQKCVSLKAYDVVLLVKRVFILRYLSRRDMFFRVGSVQKEYLSAFPINAV